MSVLFALAATRQGHPLAAPGEGSPGESSLVEIGRVLGGGSPSGPALVLLFIFTDRRPHFAISPLLMNKETDLSVCRTVFAVDVKNVTQKLTWVRQAWFGVGYGVSKYALFWFMQTSKDGFVFIFKIVYDFPGGPVVKTLCSQCMGRGFDPWTGKFCTHMAKYIIYIIYIYMYISRLCTVREESSSTMAISL